MSLHVRKTWTTRYFASGSQVEQVPMLHVTLGPTCNLLWEDLGTTMDLTNACIQHIIIHQVNLGPQLFWNVLALQTERPNEVLDLEVMLYEHI